MGISHHQSPLKAQRTSSTLPCTNVFHEKLNHNITAGTVPRKARLRVTAQEVYKTISCTAFTAVGSTGHRSKPSRGMPMSDGGTRGTAEKRFIYKAAASD